MKRLRVGTRGSELARRQTESVCEALRAIDPGLAFDLVEVATDGDLHPDRPIDETWPAGGFVGSIERALLGGRVDLAVHSYKDLPSAVTPGLTVAATPPREAPHDVLVCREPVELAKIPPGLRIGTSSARRAAQVRQLGDVRPVPIRGNVPTRLQKLARGDFDAVVLAAAGLRRLGLEPPHARALPLDRFVPAPAQGALAVQVREVDRALRDLAARINDRATELAVRAERAVLGVLRAGCAVAVGAVARVEAGGSIVLRGQLWSGDGSRCATAEERGTDPEELGTRLGRALARSLEGAR